MGEAGKRGFGRLSHEMDEANRRLAGFARRVKVAAAAAASALVAAAGAMIRSGLQVVDSQAKLAASLATTTESVQVLARAGDLAGVSMGEIEQATMQLTRRLAQAAQGTGPAVEALRRLNLIADELRRLPLDQRIAAIQEALARYVPEAQRAAVASQLFGDRAGLVFSRIDTATLRQAAEDVRDFGVAVSDQDARQIERTNDALSRLGLIWRGLSNQLAGRSGARARSGGERHGGGGAHHRLGQAIRLLFDNIGRLAAAATAFAAFMAGRWVAGLVAAAVSVRGLATALVLLRGAIIRTGIGALIVGTGELVYQFGRLVRGAGGFGNALELMGNVARAVWDGIKATTSSFVDSFRALRSDVEAIWLRLMRFLAGKWADFLSQIAPTFNRITDAIGAGFEIDAIGTQAWVSSFDAGTAGGALGRRLQGQRVGQARRRLRRRAGGGRGAWRGSIPEKRGERGRANQRRLGGRVLVQRGARAGARAAGVRIKRDLCRKLAAAPTAAA